jgi:tripartite-type tricarboxylate transporter receptor subunit TctC
LLSAVGSEPIPPSTPEEFKARFEREYAELEKLIKAADININ